MKKVIYYFNQKYLGHWNNIYNAILDKEEIKNDEINEMVYKPETFSCICEEEYSEKFKKMYMPPFCLFHKGNWNLIDSKVLGFLGKIDETDFDDLLFLKKENYTICVLRNKISNKVEKFINENEINVIYLLESNINKVSENEIRTNTLFVSEFNTDEIGIDLEQSIGRILYAISNDVYVKSQHHENIKLIFKNYQIEKKNCFIILENKIKEEISELVNEKILIPINAIKDIKEKEIVETIS